MERLIGTVDVTNSTFPMGYSHEEGHRYGEDVLYRLPDGTYLLRREVSTDSGEEYVAYEEHFPELLHEPQWYVCERECGSCPLPCSQAQV